MTTNHQIKAFWVPQPLEWGPSRHYGPQLDPFGTTSTIVDWEGTHDEKPDDN
jgi:hypothetical protein